MTSNAVPSNIIIPFMGIDFDNSLASAASADVPVTLLCVGQKLPAGTVDELVLFDAFSADEVGLKAGFGSMLHRKAIYHFKNNRSVPVKFVGIDDAVTATAAQHAWTLTGTATAAGSYTAYIAGEQFVVPVAIGDTAEALQALMAAAINTDTKLQATASATTTTITLTNRNAGLAAGDLDVRFNANRGEILPTGLTLGSVSHTPGVGDPDLGEVLAVLGAGWYNVTDQPYTDNTNMNLLEDHLDTVAGPMEMRDSVAFQAVRDTRSNMITYGENSERNNQWVVTLPAYGRRQSTYELASAVAAATAVSIQADPSIPLHRLILKGINVLSDADKWEGLERNQVARAGIATLTDEVGVQTEATVTMYRTNSTGAADTSYQYQNTMFILSGARYRFRHRMNTKYARAKLADAADNAKPGQQIMTPKVGRDEAIAWFKELQGDAWFDPSQAALEQFIKELVVTRSDSNPNRLEFLLPPDLINQFIVGSITIQFRS